MAEKAYAFPDHNIAPKKKAEKPWGLASAKAIYFANEAYGPATFYNDRELYAEYIRYAFGENDPAKYKPKLGINPRNADRSFLGGISWEIKNFATKRINQTISKVFSRQYEPIASAIDPVSVDRRESFKASVKTWMEQQAWLAERQSMLGVNMLPEGIDLSSLPMNDEELEVHMQNDYKLNTEIDTELGIKYHLGKNNFQSIKEQLDFYLTVLPVAAAHVCLDGDGLPVVKKLNPARVLAPKSEFPDFKRLPYCAYLDDYTVAEFKRLASNFLSREEIKLLVERYAKGGNYRYRDINKDFPDTERDVDTIQIMHFEVRTENELVYLERTDKFGNPRFVEKPFEYYRTKSEQEKFRTKYRDERKIHRFSYPTVYSGYWIVGSDEIFGYGEHNYLDGELGYILRATNMHEGKSTCLMKQMIPSLDAIQTYDKKIQQIVSAAIPKGVFIDLFALRNAAFKMGDIDMTPDKLLEMFFQRGILVGDTQGQTGASGSTYKPIQDLENGMSNDIVHFLALMQQELATLDEIIGYNKVSAASTLSPETGARVAQQMEQATDTALDHIYRADRGMCKDIYAALGKLHPLSVRMNPEFYTPIFGEATVNRVIQSAPYNKIGIDVEAIPTQQEWNEFYAEITEMVKTGKIEPEDKAALRRCNSLKQAHSLLRTLTRRRKKELMEQQLALVQENANTQAMSNKQAFDQNIQLEDKKTEREIVKAKTLFELDFMRHKWKMEELEKEAGLDRERELELAEVQGDQKLLQIRAQARSKPKTPAK